MASNRLHLLPVSLLSLSPTHSLTHSPTGHSIHPTEHARIWFFLVEGMGLGILLRSAHVRGAGVLTSTNAVGPKAGEGCTNAWAALPTARGTG